MIIGILFNCIIEDPFSIITIRNRNERRKNKKRKNPQE